MATFYLIIEKNLTGELSRIHVYLDNNPGCCVHHYWWSWYYYYYACSYYGCNSNNHHESHQAFQLFQSSVKIEINNQLIQDQSWNTINLTTLQQCINSSSGKSYVYLPVKVYSTNITSKSFLMHLNVCLRSANTIDVWNAWTSGEISISNGEICTSFGSIRFIFVVSVHFMPRWVEPCRHMVVRLCFCVCACVCVCVCVCVWVCVLASVNKAILHRAANAYCANLVQ